MVIKEIRINNFRSIKKIVVPVRKGKTIFVGPNESGKSNLLRAISFLNSDVEPTIDDVRDLLPDDMSEKSSVLFIIEFEESDYEEILRQFKKHIVYDDDSFIKFKNESISLKAFFKDNNQILYTVNIDKQEKFYQYWTYNKSYSIDTNLKKLKSDNLDIDVNSEETQYSLKGCSYIYLKNLKNVNSELIHETDFENIGELFFEIKKQIFLNQFPESIIWNYNQSAMLTNRINIDTFVQNPETNLILKGMFEFSSYNNIKSAIKNAKAKQNGISNLFKIIGERTSSYLHKIWPAAKDIVTSQAYFPYLL